MILYTNFMETLLLRAYSALCIMYHLWTGMLCVLFSLFSTIWLIVYTYIMYPERMIWCIIVNKRKHTFFWFYIHILCWPCFCGIWAPRITNHSLNMRIFHTITYTYPCPDECTCVYIYIYLYIFMYI